MDVTRTCHEPNMDYDSIKVVYDSPAVAQLWNNIAPTINLMGVNMKQFLGVLGVDESMISTFCKTFENANELRKSLFLYFPPSLQHPKNVESSNTGEQLNEEIIDK